MINKIKFIKILFITWLITFNFQSLTKANDIKEFEIEGMSVGSSLLDYFSKKKINSSIVDWYDDLEKNRYVLLPLIVQILKLMILLMYGQNMVIINT